MTARELYDATLIELNKLNAPTYSLPQWVYFANKAIQSYTDKRYNFYAVNQQLTDDLRILLSVYKVYNPDYSKVDSGSIVTGWEEPLSNTDTIFVDDISPFIVGSKIMFGNEFTVYTVIDITVGAPNKIKISPDYINSISEIPGEPPPDVFGLELDMVIYIVDRAYSTSKSMSENAIYNFSLESGNYYHILAVRTYWADVSAKTAIGLECDSSNIKSKSRMFPAKRLTYDMLANIENNAYLKPMYRQPYHQVHDHHLNSGIEKVNEVLGQFQNMPEIEVHAGKVPDGIELMMIEVDYLKLPEVLTLSEEEVYEKVDDESQLLEWPDYINNDIVNHIVMYFMDNEESKRTQTFPMVNIGTAEVPLELTGNQT